MGEEQVRVATVNEIVELGISLWRGMDASVSVSVSLLSGTTGSFRLISNLFLELLPKRNESLSTHGR